MRRASLSEVPRNVVVVKSSKTVHPSGASTVVSQSPQPSTPLSSVTTVATSAPCSVPLGKQCQTVGRVAPPFSVSFFPSS